MKFRFCGDADCPDWLLMQINTFSALSVEQFQELCQAVADYLQGGDDLDYARLNELGKEAKLDVTDLKACVSGLHFILRSGTRYGVQSSELGAELEQLGLEPGLAATLTSIYSNCYSGLREAAKKAMLRRKAPREFEASRTHTGLKFTFHTNDLPPNKTNSYSFHMTKGQAYILLQELKTVAKKIDKLTPQ